MPYLGLLKADVDYLGFLFHYGLHRPDPKDDRLTLSRLAQMSRTMDLFFTGYLKGLLRREFPSTYTVYAGGDDLLLIGPWRQTLKLAQRINETFRAYTGQNPNITLSAGVTLMKANYPVNRAIHEAEDFLESAKEPKDESDRGRNRICALISKPMPWERYAARLQDAEWIHKQLHEQRSVSTGFVYHIMDIAKDAEAVADGRLHKANWRARLAYHLARNIKGFNEADKNSRIIDWLERLGLDDHLKLTKEHPNLYEWRLPLTIALYRNRQ
jgi:CRISPR-associated protein Csm1